MKSITIAAALCAALFSTATAAPLSLSPSGSKNVIAPPAGAKAGSAQAKSLVVRHPTQAGKVSQTISGNFVPSAGRSWIAKGDKRYSLCATTKDNQVSCSPLVATSSMAGLEIGVIAGKGGIPLVTFKPEAGTKGRGKELAVAAGRFMKRVARLSAHLERRAVSYAPRTGESSLRIDGGKSAESTGSSGSCGAYDDFGGYDCTGGDGGGGGGGSGDTGDCNESCDYPDGNDNGDAVPNGIDPNIPVVIIVGHPEQGTEEPPANWVFDPPPIPEPRIVPIPDDLTPYATIPAGCIPGPRGTFVCPPPTLNPWALPQPKPGFTWEWWWTKIVWCKIWNNCDPKANEGDAPKPPAVTPEEKFYEAMDKCRAEAKAHMEFCLEWRRMGLFYTPEEAAQCGQNAIDDFKSCQRTAEDQFDHH